MKRLGVIGGLGPLATAYFYELLIRMTDAKTDQEHMEVLIYSKPSIPDRTAYIMGRNPVSPLEQMLDTGKVLVDMGADILVFPCITAHYFYHQLSKSIPVPIIHAVKETALYLKEVGVACAGIMATEGTIFTKLFQKELEECGISSLLPSKENQHRIMDLIYRSIKANQPFDRAQFESTQEQLRQDGAEVILLACSELSLLKSKFDLGSGYLDAMEVLAMRSILMSGARVKAGYRSLITT
jgi:aspartate racemase